MIEFTPTMIPCLGVVVVFVLLWFVPKMLNLLTVDERTPVIGLAIVLAILGGVWISRWSNPDFRFILYVGEAILLLVPLLLIIRSFRKYDEKQQTPVSASRYSEDKILVQGGRGNVQRLLNQLNIPGLIHQERVGGSWLLTIQHRQSWEVDSVVKIINEWGQTWGK